MREVVELARAAYGSGDVVYGDSTQDPHEAGWLALEIARARAVLGVAPKWGLTETVNRTMAWYRAQHEGADARALCEAEIAAYQALEGQICSSPFTPDNSLEKLRHTGEGRYPDD